MTQTPTRIEVLGDVRVPGRGRLSPLQQALLGVLVSYDGAAIQQEVIISHVWDSAKTAANFRNFLAQLRSVLGDEAIISVGRGLLQLNIAAIDVDAWRFEALVRNGRRAAQDRQLEEAARLLTNALGEWHGPMAYGFELPRSATFPERLVTEQARLGLMLESVEEERISLLLQLGQHKSVLSDIEVMVARCPDREQRWRQYALARYRAHGPAAAKEAIAAARHRLSVEGYRPSRDLLELEEAIHEGSPALEWLPPVDAETPVPALVTAAAEGFGGRRNHLDELSDPFGHVVILEGRPGTGKTSLMAKAALVLRERVGAEILYGASSPNDRPLEAVSRALELPVPAEPLGTGFDRAAPIAADTALSAAEVEIRRRAATGPVVLLLDDIHHGDDALERLVSRLAGARPEPNLAVLMAAPRGSSTVGRLACDPAIRVLPVDALDPDDVRVIANAGDDDERVAQLLRSSGGSPLLLRILLEHVAAQRANRCSPEAVLPIGVSVVRARLSSLAIEIAEWCAVLAADATSDHLTRFMAQSALELNDAVSELAVVGLFDSGEAPANRASLRFRHELLRSAFYDAMTPSRRAHLHQTIAVNDQTPAWLRAQHAFRAGHLLTDSEVMTLSESGRLAARVSRRYAVLGLLARAELELRRTNNDVDALDADTEVALLLDEALAQENAGDDATSSRQEALIAAELSCRFDLAASVVLEPSVLGRTYREDWTLPGLQRALTLQQHGEHEDLAQRIRAERLYIAGLQGRQRKLPVTELSWARSLFGLGDLTDEPDPIAFEALRAYIMATLGTTNVSERSSLSAQLYEWSVMPGWCELDGRSDAIGLQVRAALERGDLTEVDKVVADGRPAIVKGRSVDRWARFVVEACVASLRGELGQALTYASLAAQRGLADRVVDAGITGVVQFAQFTHHVGLVTNTSGDSVVGESPDIGDDLSANATAMSHAFVAFHLSGSIRASPAEQSIARPLVAAVHRQISAARDALDCDTPDFMLLPAAAWLAESCWRVDAAVPVDVTTLLTDLGDAHVIGGVTPGLSLGPASRLVAQIHARYTATTELIDTFERCAEHCARNGQALYEAQAIADLACALERRDDERRFVYGRRAAQFRSRFNVR